VNLVGGPRGEIAHVNMKSSISTLMYYVLMTMFFLPTKAVEQLIQQALQFVDQVRSAAVVEQRNSTVSDEQVHNVKDMDRIKVSLVKIKRSYGTNTVNLPDTMTKREIVQFTGPIKSIITSAVSGMNKALPSDAILLLAMSLLYGLYIVTMDISEVCYRPSTFANALRNTIPFLPDLRDKQCADTKVAWAQTLVAIKGALYVVAAKMSMQYVKLVAPSLERSGFTPGEIQGITGVNLATGQVRAGGGVAAQPATPVRTGAIAPGRAAGTVGRGRQPAGAAAAAATVEHI